MNILNRTAWSIACSAFIAGLALAPASGTPAPAGADLVAAADARTEAVGIEVIPPAREGSLGVVRFGPAIPDASRSTDFRGPR